MPPEPLPWERKDFFRKRKHERSESRGGSVARWRDSSHHGGSRDLGRWGSAEFRRPIGHGKQGGWHFCSEESGHGYASSRSGEKVVDDEGFRPISRGETRYGRYRRDNRGSYNQREWRDHSWEGRNGFSNAPGRAHDVSNEQKSRDDIATYSAHSNGGFGNTWDQIQMKDQHDKMSGSNGLGTGQRCDRENPMGLNEWKTIKWTRSGSLSSRGSGFSHLSSSKSIGAIDSSEAIESETKYTTPIQSPSGDANACVTSAATMEDTTSRKKPRLGWGEGLAKYEKKKVEGPDVVLNKDEAEFAASNVEPLRSLSSSLVDKSPRVMTSSDCGSPATPSSVACSSLPVLEEKLLDKAANVDNDIVNLSGSPGPTCQNHSEEGFSFNLETLDSNSEANLAAALSELLQSYDANSMDSSFVRATSLNKLLVWKSEVLKAVEVTETAIDQLETELKLLNSVLGGSSQSAASSSLLLGDNLNSCDEEDDVTKPIPRPAPLQILSSEDAVAEKLPICDEDQDEICADHRDGDVDSPGTMSSKFIGTLSLSKAVSSDVPTGDMDHVRLTNEEVGDSLHGSGVVDRSAFGDHNVLSEGDKAAPISDAVVLYTERTEMRRDAILRSNKDLAKEAQEVFYKLLPRGEYKLDTTAFGTVSSSQNLSVKERFVQRKRFLKFKEGLITLKFKAFQHLWKEDMRLLSIRKLRAKSQKKFELSLRSVHNGYQKHRSSIRSRFSSPAGNLSLVPTAEVIKFTSKLLSDSQVKLYRDTLKMPALILDKREKIVSRFVSNNGLVEDPCAVEKERAMINPWTPEERETFMDKFAIFGKDFKKIASFLDQKTTADCVEFYYKNHKSDCFEKRKKELDIGKPEKSLLNGNYFMRLGKHWNRERNAASLDILGAASVMVANADGNMRSRACSGRSIMGAFNETKALWAADDCAVDGMGCFDVGNERETAAADVLAGICSSLSSEAMSSYVASSVDPGDSYRERKSHRMDSTNRWPLTPDVVQNADDETCSDDSCGEMDSTDWTDEEKSIFIQAVSSYGRDFVKISHCVRTRTRDQCKVFFSKARKCLGLDMMHPGLENEKPSAGDDVSGGGGGSENACALETGSGVCSTKSVSKMDEDLPLSSMKMNQDESDPVETLNSLSELSSSEWKKEGGLIGHKENVGVSEPRSFDACQIWGGRPNVVSDGDSNIVNGVDEQSEILPVNESESVLVSVDTGREFVAERGMSAGESVSACEGNDPVRLSTGSVAGVKPADEFSFEGRGNEMEGLDEKGCARTSGQSVSPFLVHNSNSTGNASHLASDGSCSGFSLTTSNYHQHAVSLELNSKEKSCVVSLSNGISPASGNSVSLDSSADHSEKNGAEDKTSSKVDFLESGGGCCASVGRADSQDHLLGLPLLTNAESSQVVTRVYPSQMPVQEINGDIRCSKLSEVQSLPFLQKCSNLKPLCSVTEFPLVSHKMEHTIERPRAHSQSLSDSENSSRSSGDVKLFGKILSNSSSVQKATSSQRENEEKEGSHLHKSSNKSSNLKFTSLHNSDGNSPLKFDPNSYLGLENVQMRSYTYWDRQTFPTVPDSAILLAKYPAAFGIPTASSKMEQQQPLPTIAKSSERSANGVSVFPTREISSNGNGMVDYHPTYRGRDAAKVQPFTVDMKSRQDMFSEMQRLNGIEALANFQHQGRGIVGMNIVGRGGIVVGGGQCTTGVSDPVAALKLHFAKDQFGGQTSSIMREDESWRGKGT